MSRVPSARNLRDLSASLVERRRILKVAERVTGEDSFIMQQQAILEMNSPGGDLDVATERLEAAVRLQPRDTSLSSPTWSSSPRHTPGSWPTAAFSQSLT